MEQRLRLSYGRIDLVRWTIRRRPVVLIVAALVSLVMVVAIGGLGRFGGSSTDTTNNDDREPDLDEVVLDCVAADVIEVVATGAGPLSVTASGAMSGVVDGDGRVAGEWSGGPGTVTITVVGAEAISWSAGYGFCARTADSGENVDTEREAS